MRLKLQKSKEQSTSMPMEEAVSLKNITKTFQLKRKKFSDFFRFRHESVAYFQALEDISFQVKQGSCIGFIGLNGSGKSTLSSLIADHLVPSKGEIKRNGKVSLLAISSGLKPNLTGTENIELKLLLMGFKSSEIESRIENIVRFTELHDFIHQPIKQYSSGMKARLGFGIAIQTDPDILIIDEALAVGDLTFYEKCLNEIERFKQAGKTIFFVSHAISQIREICDQVAWLHYGELKLFGESEEVCLEYSKFIHHFNKKTKEEREAYQSEMMAKQYVAKKTKEKHRALNFSQFFFPALLVILLICAIGFSAFKMFSG
ncbi:ABC transporter ATP-binding protein [Listeria aquatica]|uniref:ABC transporter ATP-binding protein n=1 Tax=Listeria aquatica TaxID=1494960 RepID=UPI0031F4D3FC